jgi:hypothetical protein
MTNPKDAQVNKLSMQYGLLIGIVSVVLFVVFRMIDPVMQFSNYWVAILSFVILIVLLVVLGLDIRKKTGGYWSFGEAYRSLIIMALFFTLVSTVYNFVLIKFVDPGLPAKISAVMADKVATQLSNMGVEQSKIDEATKQFQNGEFEAKMQPTLKNELTAFAVAMLIYAVIDLIIAASIKKNPPIVFPVNDEPAA